MDSIILVAWAQTDVAHSTDRGRRRTLYVIAGGNFVVFGTRLLIGALVPFILLDLQTTKSALGLALSGMWAMYALGQFPSGILADKYGERKLLVLGLTGTTLSAILVAFAPSILVFAVFLLLVGAGAGLYYSPATVLVTRLYDEHGSAIGVLAAFGAFAGLVYPTVGGFAVGYLDWRYVLALTAVAGSTVLVAILTVIPRVPAVNADTSLRDTIHLHKYRNLLSRRSMVYTMALAVVFVFTFQGLTSFYPTFLVEYHDIDRGVAGGMLGGVLGVATVAQPLSGRFSDTVSRDAALGVSTALILTSLVALLATQSMVGAVAGSVVLGLGISYPGPLQARFMDQLDETERGYGFGLVRTVYMFLGASGSVVVGALADANGWVFAYAVVGGLLACGLLLIAVNYLLGLEL